MQVREKEKSRKPLCFSNVCGSGGSKSRLVRVAGAEPFGEKRDEELQQCEAHLKCSKRPMSGARMEVKVLKKCGRFGAKRVSK